MKKIIEAIVKFMQGPKFDEPKNMGEAIRAMSRIAPF